MQSFALNSRPKRYENKPLSGFNLLKFIIYLYILLIILFNILKFLKLPRVTPHLVFHIVEFFILSNYKIYCFIIPFILNHIYKIENFTIQRRLMLEMVLQLNKIRFIEFFSFFGTLR